MGKLCPVCALKLPADANFCPEDGSDLEQDPLVGCEFGGRRLLEFLSEDALGPTYRAEHLVLGREEAVKLLRAGGDSLLKRRFRAEAQAIARLNDPHTVRVYESGPTPDGDVFFAMELVRGRRVDEVIAAEGPMRPRRVARIAYHAAQALAAAHAQRVLHLDLRPQNVLLETDDVGRDFARVLDFGIGALGKAANTRYRAPEHLDAHQDLDRRADLFSLGVVLYELLTGLHPFLGGDPRRDRPALVECEGWEIPDALAKLVMRLLSRERDRRPGDAMAVRRALESSGLLAEGEAQVATEKRQIETARLELAEAWAELEAEKARIIRIESHDPEWDTPPPIMPGDSGVSRVTSVSAATLQQVRLPDPVSEAPAPEPAPEPAPPGEQPDPEPAPAVEPAAEPEADLEPDPDTDTELGDPEEAAEEEGELVYLEPAVSPWLAYGLGVASTLLFLGVLFAAGIIDLRW